MAVTVRPATVADLPQVHEIFEHYVLNTVLSFLVQQPPQDYIRHRFEDVISRKLPYLVAVDAKGQVVGYTYAGAFRGHMLGYGHTVEISLFCHPQHTNEGIGSRLLQQLIQTLRATKHVTKEAGHGDNPVEFDVRKVLAVMAVDETAPKQGLALRDWYLRWGFEEVGRLKGVGCKNGRMYRIPHSTISGPWRLTTAGTVSIQYISSYICDDHIMCCPSCRWLR